MSSYRLTGRTGSTSRVVLGVVAATCVVSGPAYLVAAQSVQIRAAMDFTRPILGVVLACYYLGSAVFALAGGILAELLGGPRVLRYAVFLSVVVLVAIGWLVESWVALAAVLFAAGAASTTAQSASNLVLSRRVPRSRRGLAFGVKQAGVPLAFLVGGSAVPVVALTVGWRWTFLVGGVISLAGLAALPQPKGRVGQRFTSAKAAWNPESSGPLVVLACGFGLALMACASVATYLVAAAVAGGVAPGTAGLFVAGASLGNIVLRIGTGVAIDRGAKGRFGVIGSMLGVGALGFIAMAAGSLSHQVIVVMVGGFLAFSVGWGWNGIFNLAVAESHARAPARATGMVQTGGRIGSLLGPLLFAFILVRWSFSVGWLVASIEAAAGAAVMLSAGRLIQRNASNAA